MNDPIRVGRTVRFGEFEIDRDACELRRDGRRVPLQIQPFRVLEALIDNAGNVVTRAELRATIWPATIFVDFDHGLNSAMTRLRQALGDSSDSPTFIETLPRIGYRFIHPIEGGNAATGIAPSAAPLPGRSRHIAVSVAAVALLGVLGAVVWRPVSVPDEASLSAARDFLLTVSPEARVAYLRGVDLFEQRNKEAIERSIGQLQLATEIDPDFAAAYAALAMAYVSAGSSNSIAKFRRADEVVGPALAAAERALELDPLLADAHRALAGVLNGLQPWSAGTDVAIEQAYERALALDPEAAGVHLSLGNFLATRGRSEEAVVHFREAVALDPLSPSINSRLGMELIAVGQLDAGLDYLRRTIELNPWQFNAHWRLGWAYVALGDLDAAGNAFEAAEQISPGSLRSQAGLAFIAAMQGDEERARALLTMLRPMADDLDDPFDVALVYVGLRDRENSIEWLAKAARQARTLHMAAPWGIDSPLYDWLRDDARFAEIEGEIRAANRQQPDLDDRVL